MSKNEAAKIIDVSIIIIMFSLLEMLIIEVDTSKTNSIDKPFSRNAQFSFFFVEFPNERIIIIIIFQTD